MAKHLILVSHGMFCEELKKSTEMIMGPQETIHVVPLLPSEGPDDFKAKFLEVADQFDDYIVFADLMGGTPCNVVSRLLMEGYDFDLFTGMNMPMVIGYLNGVLLETDADVLNYGKDNIHHVNELLSAVDDDEDD
ncbi:PTS sugar transporter subunit IIA [Streptococcus hongkongensis]|nr:PTS fructose transporter subunit IIA [Streptococcus uberis]